MLDLVIFDVKFGFYVKRAVNMVLNWIRVFFLESSSGKLTDNRPEDMLNTSENRPKMMMIR